MVSCLLLASTCLAAPSTGLWFSADDLPRLRQLCDGPCADLWRQVKEDADRRCDPKSSSYADPAKIDAGGSDRIVIRAHTWGRNLTTAIEPLGFAWQITGDAKYARTGIDLLLAACDKLPPEREEIAKSFAGARGDIARGLAIGLEWLGPAMTADQRAKVAACGAAYVRNILAEAQSGKAWWVPYHNFIGVAVGAAGCLSLIVRNDYPDEAPGWITGCTDLVQTWLTEGFDADGAYSEGIGYANYGLSDGTLFMDALVRTGGPNLFAHPHLQQVPEWFAMSLLPGDKVFEDRNDSGLGGTAESMLLLAQRLPSGLARWLWDRTGSGKEVFRIVWHNDTKPVSPTEAGLPLSKLFAGRGLGVFRTGWDATDLMFSIECGKYFQVTHNQRDKGHFNLYGMGGRWCIDSGYGNDRDPAGRASSLAHSVILIDGEQQAMSGAGAGTNGQILAFEPGTKAGYVLADAAEAYRTNNHNQPGPQVERALRHCFFVRPADGLPGYAVVLDDIRLDAASHTFTWQWHTDVTNAVELQSDGAWARPEGVGGGAFVETPPDAEGQGSVTLAMNVPAAGKYRLWAKVRAGGEIVASSDSFIVQVNGGQQVHWHMPSSPVWRWGTVGEGIGGEQKPLELELAAGRQTIKLLTREAGAQVDRLALLPLEQSGPPLDPAVIVEAESGQVAAPMRVVALDELAQANLRMVLTASAPLKLRLEGFDGHPRVSADATAVEPRFVAVFTPLAGATHAPQVERTVAGGEDTIKIVWPSRTDVIVWPREAGAKPALE